MSERPFAEKIVNWYHQNKRDLPWRSSDNPYHIWLSEVILQQTRVEQGMPYYFSFIKKFETIYDLANADERDVLRVWQGLGYYSRARNLHKCSKIIVEEHDGQFPVTYAELLKLPGIGTYTAAAIASFAFKEKVAVVDGNVFRVLSRVFGIEEDIASSKGHKAFQKLANELISDNHPDDFNQGTMEFGALHCTPKNPQCDQCIFRLDCVARQKNLQSVLPVKVKKVKVRHRYFNYIVIRINDTLLLKKRRGKGIWEGLFDFPLIETNQIMEIDDLIDNEDFNRVISGQGQIEVSKEYKHILSHQQIHAKFYEIIINNQDEIRSMAFEGNFYDKEEILELPKPVLISAYLNDSFF